MKSSTFYVSQKFGDDGFNGLCHCVKNNDGPFKTVEKALDAVATMRLNGENQPITIKIVDDVYNVTEPIVIKNNVDLVTIEPMDKTLLSGGIKVDFFKRDEFCGKACFSADLSGYGDLVFTDFYVDGKLAPRPKYPQNGTLSAETVEYEDKNKRSKWFIAMPEDFDFIKEIKKPDECIISFNHFWASEHTPIESIDLETRKVTFKYRSRFSISKLESKAELKYIIENVAETFGNNLNEWYFDRVSKILYYMPKDENAKPEDVVGYVPVTRKIFVIAGTTDKKVKNITIRNFDIAYTEGEHYGKCLVSLPDDPDKKEWQDFASDAQSVWRGYGGIEFENAYSCAVENCNIFCLGVNGIVLKDGSKNIRITKNRITNLGGGGITINGGEYGSDEKTHTCNITVTDNTITQCGNRYRAGCGVLMRHTYENTVAHNEISYLYYSGISCGWRWGYGDSICHDNLIEKNHIHHIGQGVISDMGGIYLLGKQPGTIVCGNLIHDVECAHYGAWCLYADEGTSYVTFENNVCYNTNDSIFHQHYGTMNTVRNNIFAFSKYAPVHVSRREDHIAIFLENNIVVSDGTPVYWMGYLGEDEDKVFIEGQEYNLITAKDNLLFDYRRPETMMIEANDKEYSPEDARKAFGIDEGSVVGDPCFKDIANFNFTLCENSPAEKIGFKPIDISDAGVRN